MIITRIERQKKNPRRYNIYVDEEFALGLDKNVVIDHGLRKGDRVDDKIIETLEHEDQIVRAYAVAFRFLSYRPRSEWEIVQRLRKAEYPDRIIEDTIGKLRTQKLLNDRRFAELFAESRALHKPVGAYRLTLELRKKGISDDIIEDIITEYASPDEELARARAAAKKKLASERSRDPHVRKRRLTAFLARRGFGWDVIEKILNPEK